MYKTYNSMTVKELRAEAKLLGLKGYYKLRKAELYKLITDTTGTVFPDEYWTKKAEAEKVEATVAETTFANNTINRTNRTEITLDVLGFKGFLWMNIVEHLQNLVKSSKKIHILGIFSKHYKTEATIKSTRDWNQCKSGMNKFYYHEWSVNGETYTTSELATFIATVLKGTNKYYFTDKTYRPCLI